MQLAVFVLLAPALGAAVSDPTYIIVVSRDVPVDGVTLDELRRIFLMKQSFWKPGRPVRLVLPPTGHPARALLVQGVCQRTEGEYRRLTLEAIYRGDVAEPPRVASEADALEIAGSSNGVIAFVSADAHLPEGAKKLLINGKPPADPAYPLAH